MSSCLFCEIVEGRIPAKKAYEDDEILAFHDIHPQAPTHVLVVPKKHIASLEEAAPEDEPMLGRLLAVCRSLANELGVGSGYRVVVNRGPQAGQSVFHLHFHVLGGRPMGWPPG